MKRVYLGHGAMIWVGALLAGALGYDMLSAPGNAEMSAALRSRGEAAAEACQSCHSLSQPLHQVGPHLMDIVGRRAGTAPGYRYSPAMRASGVVWTRSQLRAFLLDPTRVVPGTAMAVAGWSVGDADAVIDYLDPPP